MSTGSSSTRSELEESKYQDLFYEQAPLQVFFVLVYAIKKMPALFKSFQLITKYVHTDTKISKTFAQKCPLQSLPRNDFRVASLDEQSCKRRIWPLVVISKSAISTKKSLNQFYCYKCFLQK